MKKIILFTICLCLFGTSCNTTDQKDSNEPVSENSTPTTVKMILDLDTGIDDAMALAYALGSPDIELLGIVGTYGNVKMTLGVENSINLLDLLNRKDIPVYRGASHSVSNTKIYEAAGVSKFIHGANGIGDVTIPASTRQPESGDGIDFIIESARKYGKDLVIVATGPMTNLTMALKKEPKLKDMVGKVIIMGGALIVPGNINQYAEANIFQDPVAANDLFQSDIPLTMVGLDVTLRTNLTKKDTQIWRELGTASGKAYADIVDYYIDAYGETAPELAGCALHDPLAVALAIHPEYVETLPLFMKVGTTKEDWGRTIGNTAKLNAKNPNVQVCVNVQHEEFVNNFMKTLTNLFQKN